MIHYRRADWPDVVPLVDLIEKGFAVQKNSVNYHEGKEHRVLFSYLYSQEGWKPDWVYLAEESHRLIAAVGVFPQQLSFEGRYLPVWAVSPVVTDPDYRSHGIAAACMHAMFDDLRANAVPAVFLWGIPFYYPRFGFVPVLPRYKTKISASHFAFNSGVDSGRFRSANTEDVAIMQKLYAQNDVVGWLQPLRDISWWEKRFGEFDSKIAVLKEVPFPIKENFKIWENSSGEVRGYLYLEPAPEKKQLIIKEGAASDGQTARAMLASVLAEIAPDISLIIRGTPEHYLNNAAYHSGGIHMNPAPLAGMLKVLDWERFFNELHPVLEARLIKDGNDKKFRVEFAKDNARIGFEFSGRLEIQINNGQFELDFNEGLTRLMMGIYDDDDLRCLSGDGSVFLQRLFPRKYPFIWDANYLY